MADPGEAPPLFLDQTEAQRAEEPKNVFWRLGPLLSQGVDLALLTGTMWQKTQNISQL